MDGSPARRRLLAGVDVGGSTIDVLVADSDLRVVARRQVPTDPGGDPVAQIGRVVEESLAEAGRSSRDLAAVGVGVPGQVDVADGVVALAVNLAWPPLPLGPLLAERLGVPCVVENDVRAAAAGLAWRWRRAHDGAVPDLAFLSVGTGIAAGVVLEGRLRRGRHGLAGEIGHLVVDPAGPVCGCGLTGCLEAVAAGPAIARQARDAVATGRLTRLPRDGTASARHVFEAAAVGDPVALEIAERVGRHLARAVHLLAMTYDVERIAIGGGVAAAGRPFFAPILAELERLRDASPLVRRALAPGGVELVPPEADAGPWGALALVLDGSPADVSDPGSPAIDGPAAGREIGDVEDGAPSAAAATTTGPNDVRRWRTG
ncbi:MAG TPA: ROK family protein [Candidatus Binatia bacterium]|nr:ROK family protein [Candidatus Binatia bacterium]